VGEFSFITMGLSLHPSYPSLVSRLCSSTTTFLDLGTCVGQDLRKLVYDGAPSQNLFGCDIFPQYESVGYELFRDRETFQNRFITADLFDTTSESALMRTKGTWDVISIVMFLHVFDRNTQILACTRILQLLSRKPGSMIIGAQTGSTQPEEHVLKPPFVAEGEYKTVYRQSQETFTDMWKMVEKDEDVKLRIQVQYDEHKDRELRAKEEDTGEKNKFFSGQHQRRLFFTIEIM
jgi:SAM-dependent methyltransferase